MASRRQNIKGFQRQRPNKCRSFLFPVIKDRSTLTVDDDVEDDNYQNKKNT